ncbi:cytochrome ubiquinol oxidase subunit I [Archaeoglobus neptunius]|uniref:cytochrome ubiquinol oxidase subunit I n=1 Tax=Archaeoglobus neptunius TaxID=2798580 RepID=UPI0019292947|nr:cytochrome ubiquinol oxidase subunit I [Archaeoglobus neptunius]
MNAVITGFSVLGLAVLIHIILVSITLGTGWISAFARLMAYREDDAYLEFFARRVFKILVIFELFSGVWGTIITVFLAGFFPSLTALATNVLFTPILIALIGIMIRIPSIGIFWYTWGKVSPRYHSAIGMIMAVSGFAIPFGFRTIFAEINHPTAVADYLAGVKVVAWNAYLNPTFWILYLHTIFAALSVGGFVVAYLMAMEKDKRGSRIGYRYGLVFLAVQIPIGIIYWASLADSSPYIFSTVTFGHFIPVLTAKVTVVLALLVLSLMCFIKSDQEALNYAKYTAILSLTAVFLGELMNSGARYPYMVVTGEKGLLASDFFNFYIVMPMVAVTVIVAFLFVSIAVFLTAMFYALFKRYLPEIPEE